MLAGCASQPGSIPVVSSEAHHFEFGRDTFAFSNQLFWEYEFGGSGEIEKHSRRTKVEYGHRCVPMVRGLRQFYDAATFAPDAPRLSDDEYRDLVREVFSTNPWQAPERRIEIPGYASLYTFSLDHEDLIKEEIGGSWRTYVQRGNWRMILPFTDRSQRGTAREVLDSVDGGRPAIVRIVNFPRIDINHSIVVYAAEESEDEIRFSLYDPNQSDLPLTLRFDRRTATFHFPRTPYFEGGSVKAYAIYTGLFR